MRPAKIFERFIQPAAGLGQLPRAEKTARGKIGVPQPFREFAQNHVPRWIFRIEQRHAFIARERLDTALMLQEKLGGGGELLDGFRGVILLLQQAAVAHQSIGRLRIRPEKTAEDRGSLGGVAHFEQAVELGAVILGGQFGLVQPGMDVRKSLQCFLMRGHLFQDSLVFGNRLAELVLFEAAPRPLEMLVDVRSHENSRAAVVPGARVEPKLYNGRLAALQTKSRGCADDDREAVEIRRGT